ncbi:MAG: metal-dependent hydrolase [Verrucomicrobia bacterium]|nr:metal-dependent hydrolase [Verrucomicrobiota bacterium]MDE3099549.1 metal-dependent hydrolase [Verrucomicrobiota bacterium]
MPNAKAHLVIGAVAGALVNVTMQRSRMALQPSTRFDLGELLACAGSSGLAALLPDLLEPATLPNHRAFFHSVAMAGIVAYAVTGKHTGKWPITISLLAGVAGIGYLSHIAADAITPKSIRFI